MHKLVNTFQESKRIIKKRLHDFHLTETQSDLLALLSTSLIILHLSRYLLYLVMILLTIYNL